MKKLLQLRLRNVNEVFCVADETKDFLVKDEMSKPLVIKKGTVIVDEGIILAVGPADEIEKEYNEDKYEFTSDLDLKGCCLLPGFVDAHTHPCWDGDRSHEYSAKLEGATYMDIHKAGGGIGFTVRHTRSASEAELSKLLLERLDRMLSLGTTTAEAKSGYGLDYETEAKMLRVIKSANSVYKHPVSLVASYLGAHSVPEGTTAVEYTEKIVSTILPKIMEDKKAGLLNPVFIDVFHEAGIFEASETKRILEAGKAAGLDINFHGDELHFVGSGELGGEIGARAISHLEFVSEEGITSMLKRPSFAVLLPTTAFIMKLTPPPARRLIEAGVPVVLASDYNPNAHCFSLPFVMNLGCILMKMTIKEAIVACTLNAAASINRTDVGAICKGKRADFVVLAAPSSEHICYQFIDPPISMVFKDGKCVVDKRKK